MDGLNFLRFDEPLPLAKYIGHGAHLDRPEAPRLPAYPRPRGSSRAGGGRHETMGTVVL